MNKHEQPSIIPYIIRIVTLGILLYVCLFSPTADSIMVHDASTGPSYAEDVRPIMVKKCASCHTKQGLPNLLEYKVAYSLRGSIRQRVRSREMPYTGRLTESERGTILQWTKRGKE